MHDHTPTESKYLITRFLRYLFSPIKVFRYYSDGTDICAVCNAYIALPQVYFSPVVNGIYILSGIAIGVIIAQLPYLRLLIVLVLMGAFHHVVSSFILAFFPWEIFDPKVRSVQAHYRDTAEENKKKATCLSIGLVHGVLFSVYMLH